MLARLHAKSGKLRDLKTLDQPEKIFFMQPEQFGRRHAIAAAVGKSVRNQIAAPRFHRVTVGQVFK